MFTASYSIMSRAIRHLTGEPCSHVALECDGWVVHSNLLGVRVDSLKEFSSHSQIRYSVPIPMTTGTILSNYLEHRRAHYDFGALLYLGLRVIPVVGHLLPKKNLWQSSGMYLCTEWATSVIDGKTDSMITPYQLYLRLESAK